MDNQTRASFIKLLDTWEIQGVFAADRLMAIRRRLALILQAEASNAPPAPAPMAALPSQPMGMHRPGNGGGAPPQLVNTLVNQVRNACGAPAAFVRGAG